MAAEAVEVLMKKGKRATASYIQGVCSAQTNSEILNELFDTILNPSYAIDHWETIDWCRWLLAGGKTPEEYTQTVRKYDNATTCGLVWTANFVAYRCRTCGISPCMSLCSECFQRGNHEGHDFNMFRSQAGGACDCGDKSVMRESGFCQRHGPHNQLNKPEAPPDLLCVAEAFMPRLFLRLVQHLRDNSEPATLDRYHSVILLADGFLTLLHAHSEMGAAMRDVMTRALTNPQLYFQLAVDCEGKNQAATDYKIENLTKYLDSRNTLESGREDISFVSEMTRSSWYSVDSLKHSSFLDELVFWTIKFEFPQKLVCLLLNMMPDLNYKEAFTKIFVKHYDRISKMLARSTDSDTLSNRVVHVSVQLFSNEDLAYQMTKDYGLLRIMVDSLNAMMLTISHKSTLQCADKNEHQVVDCGHRIMKEHCYWPLVSDLNNVLTHEAVAFEFLGDTNLLNLWFKFLSLFQGMNVNQRELKAHVEFESNTYYAAFSAELEASATPMWALISHLKSPESLDKTKEVLSICIHALEEWFTAISFSLEDEINAYQVSFHLPLHRCFASFLGQAVRQQFATMDDLLPPEDTLKLMMMHPLQAQVAFHEILCNMWVRSGLQIKGQAMTYIQCHFCNSIVDADLFLLQLCAMKLDPDWFLKTVMQRFHVWEWLTFHPSRTNSFLESDKVLPMLEGALLFLATLLSTHTNIGQTEEEVTRQEMVSLLCMSDRTHSQLMDLLPDKCGATSQNKDFETILNKVADYKAPNFEAGGTMLQGTYVPKPEIWEEEYDPLHVLLRAVHRREYQSSLDRYAQHLRLANKFSGSQPPWPPYRIPGSVHKEFEDPRRILHCKTMHGIIFTILHRAVNDPNLPEQVLSLCIYLLDMAVRLPCSNPVDTEVKERKEVEDLNCEDWFHTSDTLRNVSHVIGQVVITEKVVMSMRMVEEMEVDEEVEEDDDDDDEEEEEEMEIGIDNYSVQSPVVVEEFQDTAGPLPPLATMLGTFCSQLALPIAESFASPDVNTVVIPVTQENGALVPLGPPVSSAVASSSSTSYDVASSSSSQQVSEPSSAPSSSSSFNMALIPTSEGVATVRPKCMKLKQVPGRHRFLLSDKGLPLVFGCSSSPYSENSSDDRRYMAFSSKRTIDINESILSLLLQLHSKLSERPDSYKLNSDTHPLHNVNPRIGDGVLFVERLIDQIALSGDDKVAAIQAIRHKLWPKTTDSSGSPSIECMDKEERRRRAKERQQKLMAEFASKQKAFMQKTLETECSEGASGFEDPDLNKEKEYECVICGQMTASEEARPVGMVVLLQATSVVGHYHENPVRKLPCVEEERLDLQKGNSLSTIQEKQVDLFTRHFDNKHWPLASNIGWKGGVHIQSCGHYLHIDCHKSYVQSLKSQNQISSRLQNLAVDRGEYSCPLCRQLANSVIPLNPNYAKSSLVHCPGKELKELAIELNELLFSPFTERESMFLKKYMCGFMEDMTNATYPQYRSIGTPNSSSLFQFICSVARTNLEVELIQRGGSLSKPSKRKSCFVPLLHTLSMNSRLLSPTLQNHIWTRLTGLASSDQYSVTIWEADVPLIVRDATAVLLQIVIMLPSNVDKAYYWCIVQAVFNFLCIQAIVQFTCALKRSQRTFWIKKISPKTADNEIYFTDPELKNDVQTNLPELEFLLGYVISYVEPSSLYSDDNDEMDARQVAKKTKSTIYGLSSFMRDYSLHFLRMSALLQSHLYEEDIPKMEVGGDEFRHLCEYLNLYNLVPTNNALLIPPSDCINWIFPDPRPLLKTWCQDFVNFVDKSDEAARALILRHFVWHPPALLRLPHNYDEIFKYYHKKPCMVCHSEPKDPSLCLVCGTMVCLRENCCRQQAHYEAVLHSITCGAGTAMYLAVNSSTIIVIRGKRACLWGSVYLDSYGEEDRDLKRGKPLFLSEDRYNLLQQQWINHSFDHTNKRWVWHKDNL